MQLSHMKDLMQENNQLKQQHQEMKLPKMSATKLNDDYIVEQLNRIIAERDEKIRSLTESLKHLSGEMVSRISSIKESEWVMIPHYNIVTLVKCCACYITV